MTHEDHKAVELEHTEVSKTSNVPIFNLFPNTDSNESKIDEDDNEISEYGTASTAIFFD
jgi:hypothetical protein